MYKGSDGLLWPWADGPGPCAAAARSRPQQLPNMAPAARDWPLLIEWQPVHSLQGLRRQAPSHCPRFRVVALAEALHATRLQRRRRLQTSASEHPRAAHRSTASAGPTTLGLHCATVARTAHLCLPRPQPVCRWHALIAA